MSVLAADSGNFTSNAGLGLTAWALLIFVALPLLALGMGVRSRRRSHREGAASTAWASAALLLVRTGLVLFVFAICAVTIRGDSEAEVAHGAVTRDQTGALVVPAHAPQVTGECAVVASRDKAVCGGTAPLLSTLPPNVTPTSSDVEVKVEPSSTDLWRFRSLKFASWGALLLGGLSIERILRRTASRAPFAIENVFWIRLLALCVAVYGWLVQILGEHFADGLITHHGQLSGQEGSVVREYNGSPASLAPLGVAILILVLAEVWRFGIRLQEDVEATV